MGSADGVRIVRERGAIVVVFTPKAQRLWRRVRGRRVNVACWRRGEPDDRGFFFVSEGTNILRAPKRGQRLRTGDLSRYDYCRVRRRGRVLVSIPLTQKGAVYLDEQSKAWGLLSLLTFASRSDGSGYPTAPELFDYIERRNDPTGRLVALPSPDATPPAGRYGYWGHGAQRVAVVTLSASGRRLFIEFQGDDVIRSNVIGYIYGELD